MRTELCLRSFNNYDYRKLRRKKIELEYYNDYLGRNVDYKVCDFYWACSRKSYLPCGQTYDVYSYDSIVNAIKANARLIELDIYSDELSNPVVRAEYMMPIFGKPLNFEHCIKLIAQYGWIDGSNYPMILFLGIHTNNRLTFQKIAEIIKKHLGSRLLNKKYSFAGRNGEFPLGQIPLKDLMGNVAIVVDKYPLIGVLNELVNAEVTKDQQFITIVEYTSETKRYGGIVSTNANIGELINYNKFNITMVDSNGIINPINDDNILRALLTQNLRDPKSDLYNADPDDCWKYGCQWVMMNYQLYDDNMRKYMEKFRDGGIVLKPAELRFIEKPKPKVKKQNVKAYYRPNVVEQKGWYKFNI